MVFRLCFALPLYPMDLLALVQAPPRASERDMTRFHADEYINFLKTITPEIALEGQPFLRRCTLGDGVVLLSCRLEWRVLSCLITPVDVFCFVRSWLTCTKLQASYHDTVLALV